MLTKLPVNFVNMGSWGVVGLMVATGVCLAFQAPINAALCTHVGRWESSLISFCVGTAALVLLVLLLGDGNLRGARNATWWQFLGGLIGVVVVTATAFAVPKIGAAGMLVAFVLGQALGALAIDAGGLLGIPRKPLEWTRVAGLALLVVSVVLINWKRLDVTK
jgi:transporter family-2 protein